MRASFATSRVTMRLLIVSVETSCVFPVNGHVDVGEQPPNEYALVTGSPSITHVYG